jgi:hypothetical protein
MDDSSLPPNVIRLFPRTSSTNSSTKQEHTQRGPERRRYSRRRPEQNQQGPGERQLPDRRHYGQRRHWE